MNRFFLIPLLVLLILATGCTCSFRGNATMPTAKPTTAPVMTTAPAVSTAPATAAPTMSAAPETVAPVEPTATDVLPSASATAGN